MYEEKKERLVELYKEFNERSSSKPPYISGCRLRYAWGGLLGAQAGLIAAISEFIGDGSMSKADLNDILGRLSTIFKAVSNRKPLIATKGMKEKLKEEQQEAIGSLNVGITRIEKLLK